MAVLDGRQDTTTLAVLVLAVSDSTQNYRTSVSKNGQYTLFVQNSRKVYRIGVSKNGDHYSPLYPTADKTTVPV